MNISLPQHMKESLDSIRIEIPNFFILGAGRCGSTTLYSMLRQHPQIFMPKIKEPSFFCSYFQVVKDPISYFNLFNPTEEQIAIGEASHVYLSNPESAKVIHALIPNAKFILIFRNPTERAYSLYQWARKGKHEPLGSFEEAIEAEEQRHSSAEFFQNCPHYFWNFMYVRSSYFHLQWERYLRFYSLGQFFPLSLNELVSDPLLWIQRIYDFLGVDRSFAPNVEHQNIGGYEPMSAETKLRLDEQFKEVISATHDLAGRDMQLNLNAFQP
jgi:hypothetical protein